MNENNDNLSDYFQVIWRKKWLIIIATFFCVAVAAILSFSLPKNWEVDCIIKPSKFFIQSETGEFKEITVINPQQISVLINNKTYDTVIADELGLSLQNFPKLNAKELKGTNLIQVSTRVHNVERGKSVLQSLFTHVGRDLDSKIELEMKGLENLISNNANFIEQKELSLVDKLNEIKVIENEKKLLTIDIQKNERYQIEKQQEILSLENLLKISQEREKNILSELDEVKKRIKVIEEQHMKALSEENKEKSALSLLLYSNEIQQNMQCYNTLDKELLDERIRQENWRLNIKEKGGAIMDLKDQTAQIKTQMDTLNTRVSDKKNEMEKINNDIGKIQNSTILLEERQSRIDYTRFVKEPTSSLFPVSPKRKLNLIIAFILGITVFTLFAFILEYIKPQG